MLGKPIGHTFNKHGSHNTLKLKELAIKSKRPQGQWLNDEFAEKIIANNLSKLGNGSRIVKIPKNIGRVIDQNGTYIEATHAILVPSKNGVKTAYPGTYNELLKQLKSKRK